MQNYQILIIVLVFGVQLPSEASGRHTWIRNYGRRRQLVSSQSFVNHTFSNEPNPIVQFKDGGVRGFTMKTVTGRAIDAFQTIPYAQPPIGNLRFRAPLKNVPWNRVIDAIAQSPQCLQVDLLRNLEIHGDEDCLYLNVYRPQSRNPGHVQKRLLPVMVWIHGGGYFFGAGSIFGPAYLLNHDIVLVTFNYRLGPFGFLSTGDDASSGNWGLKDQVLALKWVKENIQAFGGDPNSVSIFGESSGGVAVHHHIVSPLSQGLFHRAISESASGMCQWSIVENSPEVARRVGNLLNCTGTTHQMVECLRGLDARTIVPIQLSLYDWSFFPTVVFGPVVEHKHKDAFLIETPEEAYKNGRAAKVPWIHGFNKDEMGWLTSALMLDPSAVADINNDYDRVGPIFLGLTLNTTEINAEVARIIWKRYMGNSNLTFETRHQFATMFGDRFFIECGLEAIRYHSRFTGKPVYSYQLTYEGRYSIVQLYGQDPKDWGVVHLDDLIYLFNNTDYYTTLQSTDEEFKMSQIMTSMWTNFASHGRPYLESGKKLRDVWEPIPPSTTRFSPIRILDLNLNPKMIEDPYVERYRFWRSLDLVD